MRFLETQGARHLCAPQVKKPSPFSSYCLICSSQSLVIFSTIEES
jgi:hypothetical protein